MENAKGKDMSQPNHLSALKITDDIQIEKLKKETQDYFNECEKKLGFISGLSKGLEDFNLT